MSATEEVKDREPVEGNSSEESEKPMPSVQEEPTQQQTRYRKSPYAPSDEEEGGSASPEDANPIA
ncbi:hypothetical protein SAY86_009400 [Trapa natans]|uniref:Uncharacterized protein n=1 Tax=Trapa natans TaxID=22666 RepID=A0AAN7KWR7_TRANT|nr:hypothetical protein SAY86_009400 [Trapa natans]